MLCDVHPSLLSDDYIEVADANAATVCCHQTQQQLQNDNLQTESLRSARLDQLRRACGVKQISISCYLVPDGSAQFAKRLSELPEL